MKAFSTKQKKAAWIVALGSLFYLYEFFIRVTPLAIADDLMRDLSINAFHLGILSSAFFCAYAPMQIPAGFLCDRFGPSKTLTWAAGTCAIATMIFAISPFAWLSTIARFFIGLSAAFAFIGPLALAKRWVKPHNFPMTTGLVQLLGCLGAIMATGPIDKMASLWGWRPSMVYAALAGLILTALYRFCLSDYPLHKKPDANDRNAESVFKSLKAVVNVPGVIWVALIGFTSWAPISVFAELWGANFLVAEYHLESSSATAAIVWVWLGIAVGSPIIGWWSNRIQRRKAPLFLCFATGAIASFLLIEHYADNQHVLHTLLFLLGASASAQVMSFAVLNDIVPTRISSTAVGFNNMFVIAGGVLLQPLVGYILESHWDHTMINNVPVYSLHAYHEALLMLPVISLAGILISLFALRETHPKRA